MRQIQSRHGSNNEVSSAAANLARKNKDENEVVDELEMQKNLIDNFTNHLS